MDVSTILTLIQTLNQLIDSESVKGILSSVWWVVKPSLDLDGLRGTMNAINARVADAARLEEQQLGEIPEPTRNLLINLEGVLYQMVDLFDEINYVAQRKEMSGNTLRKAQLFFSRYNPVIVGVNINRKINKIEEMLDKIKKDENIPHVGGVERSRPVRQLVNEARRLVHETGILGRDGDKKKVINMLMDVNVEQQLGFVAIVGIGGMGKTTLANLVRKDIENKFDLYLFVCVGQDNFATDWILNQLLPQLQKSKDEDRPGYGFNPTERDFMKRIKGKKYLLLLDDVWSCDKNVWDKLKELLGGGGKGSRVMVTTRNTRVAIIVGCKSHELKGLNSEESWSLFKNIALPNEEEKVDDELQKIGDCILSKCHGLPLAIRVVAATLTGEPRSKWRSIMNCTNILTATKSHDDTCGIMPILKLSYYDLDAHLRRCFISCAMFPQDYKLKKETLIYLWMAHDWIGLQEGQSVEDIGECYLNELLQRGFLQVFYEWGREFYKIHDLLHDMALIVQGSEMLLLTSSNTQVDERVRHVSYDHRNVANSLHEYKMKNARTIFQINTGGMLYLSGFVPYELQLPKATYLRALSLSHLPLRCLPSSINELIHLRFLDLSGNEFLEVLSESLADLINLQVLLLSGCGKLKILPRGLSRLVNVNHLDIENCCMLRHMPPGMKSMTHLQRLTAFVVDKSSQGNNYKQDKSS